MNRLLTLLGLYALGAVVFVVLAFSGSGERTQEHGKSGYKMLRLATDTEPRTLDPISIADTISDGVARKIHNTLVRFEKKDGVLVVGNDICESRSLSPDGKLYTFNLRKGVLFHNGREMVSEDVAYSFRRLLSPESKRQEWLKPFVKGSDAFAATLVKNPKLGLGPETEHAKLLGIRPTGKYSLEIELTEPFAPFIMHLCTSNCAVIPREAVEEPGRIFARNPMGLGAFKVSEWKDNAYLTLERNENYFRGKPKLNAIRFYIIKESSIRVAKFFAGELDAAGDLPNGQLRDYNGKPGIRSRAGKANSFQYDAFRTTYLGFGFPEGKFKNDPELQTFGKHKLLRQAVSYAIDREYLCREILEGRGTPANGVLPPGMPAHKASRPGWSYDVKKAKELLAQAGYPDGKGLPPVSLLHRNDENSRRVLEAVAHDLEKVGIKIDLKAMEWNSFLEAVENKPHAMFWLGWVADYPDPDNFLYVLFNSKQYGQAGNHTWFTNEFVDEMTQKARGLPKMEDRIPIYEQVEDKILDEMPWICMYTVKNEVLMRDYVTGIRENATPLDTGTEFPQVEFSEVDIAGEQTPLENAKP